MNTAPSRNAFTLVELLIVIAVIAILSTVAVITINPAQLLAQGRDSNRIADMSSLSVALANYQSIVRGSMGNANTIYLSLPDGSSTCGSWNLPTAPSGTVYQCAPSSTYKNIDGSGWIPVSFKSMGSVAPISVLPVDPVNTSSTGLYYAYAVSGTQYEVTSLFESQKYKTQYAQNPIDPGYPEVDAQGNSFAVSPLFNPSGLVGYWPMDEGSGSSTIDASGNNNIGMWGGNTPYYASGKVGNYAGNFNGSNDYIQTVSSINLTGQNTITLEFWMYENSFSNNDALAFESSQNYNSNVGAFLVDPNNSGGSCAAGTFDFGVKGSTYNVVSVTRPSASAWHEYALVMNSTSTANFAAYIDGAPVTITSCANGGGTNLGNYTLYMMSRAASSLFNAGKLDDVRIYNRALSASEISSLYNSQK